MLDFSLSHKLTDNIVVNNDLIFVLQQIDLLFDTDVDDVLGNSFGSNYDKYLYTLGVSNTALESKILNDISSLDLRGFTPSVTVSIVVEGTYRDIAFINITLTGDYEDYEKTYVIK